MASSSTLDTARRQKDRSYRHIFKGTVLVNQLMDWDKTKFTDRSRAVEFGQRLLDNKHVESIVGSKVFEDGASLYRWCDESLIQDAKKHYVTTTTSHIPKKRLIELLDMEQDGVNGYDLNDMKDRVVSKLDRTVAEQSEPRAVGRLSRKDMAFAQRLASEHHNGDFNDKENGYTDNNVTVNIQSNTDTNRSISHGSSSINHSPSIPNHGSSSTSSDPIFTLQTSSTDEYTSTSDNNITPSQSDSTDSPIDRQLAMEDPPSHTPHHQPQSLSNQSSVFEEDDPSCKFEDVDEYKRSLGVEDREAYKRSLEAEDREALLVLENLTQDSSSLSDNEKTLLEQIRRMEENHASTVEGLVMQIQEMRSMAGKIQEVDVSQQGVKEAGSSTTPDATATDKQDDQANVPTAPTLPPPVAPPTVGLFLGKVAQQPNKPQIKPRVKMRPLFWNRILLKDKNVTRPGKSVWNSLTEPNFDVDEFEEIFGVDPSKQSSSQTRSLHDAMSPTRSGEKLKTVKLLEDNRSRTIGIKLRSMHCQLGDIKDAVYRLHDDKLDVESMQSLYELRGSAEEISKIEVHLKEHRKRSSALDQPEQFLYEVSRMQHFEERVECLLLRKRFNETLFNIDEQLNLLRTACDSLRNNETLKRVMEMVLAFGNYMNGGTQRGQADGFDITILTRLKDVKSMDNSTTLLRFVVRIITREYEEDAGQNGAKFRLPDPSVMQQAAVVSLKELEKELRQMQPTLKTHQKKAEKVYAETEKHLLQPFKSKMEEFFNSAFKLLKRQATKYEETRQDFEETLDYLSATNTGEEHTTDSFFSIWAQFLVDYKAYWETEQKRIAKEMFAKIEQRKKERRQKVKRRNSIVEEGRENLKQKFAQMRKRSENVAPHTAALIRSQSVSSIDTVSSQSTNSLERSSLERRKRGNGTETRNAGRDDDSVFADDEDGRSEAGAVNERRRRRGQVEIPNGASHQIKALDRCISEPGVVDNKPQRNLGKMPNILNSLGDPNMKIKMYYRKTKDEGSRPDSQARSQSERPNGRTRSVSDQKTHESVIEKLQLRRQRSNRTSQEDQHNSTETGYESSQTMRASGSNDDTDKESNALQERMLRRRRSRSNLTDDGRVCMDVSLGKTPGGLRRSRTNLTDVAVDSGQQLSATDDRKVSLGSLGKTSGGLRRSRTNLTDTTDGGGGGAQLSSTTQALLSTSAKLRRSRSTVDGTTTSRFRTGSDADKVTSTTSNLSSVSRTLGQSSSSLVDTNPSRVRLVVKSDKTAAPNSVSDALKSRNDLVNVDDLLAKAREEKPEPRDLYTASNSLRRSRNNLSTLQNDENDQKVASKDMNAVPSSLRRSRANLVDDSSKDSKPEPVAAGKHSAYLRRSRTNLYDDSEKEGGRLAEARARLASTENRVNAAPNLTQARSRFGQSMESLASNGAESTSSVRSRVRPNVVPGSETRRRLPSEPKSNTDVNIESKSGSDTSSSWRTRLDSFKGTGTSDNNAESKPNNDTASALSSWRTRLDSITSAASAGITAIAQKFDSIGQTETAKQGSDINQNNPVTQNMNESGSRRERSRRHSSDVATIKDIASAASIGAASVQERSRIFAEKSESHEPLSSCNHKAQVAGSLHCGQPGCPGNRPSLRSAQSMDTLNKPLSLTSSTSGSRVRDRLNSYEASRGGATNPITQSEPRRTRNRAGSDLGLPRSRANTQELGIVSSEQLGVGSPVRRDSEALKQRDYRDILQKLSRGKDGE